MTHDRIGRGAALGALAYGLFAVHDATNKWLVATLPVWQLLFFRSGVIVAGCLAVGRKPLLRRLIATPLRWPLAARATLTLTAWLAYYSAARSLPLAQLLTLYFSAPLVTTLLAIPLLGERVSGTRWVSVLLGFLGVLVVAHPVGMRATQATWLVLAAAAIWGYTVILMRRIARLEPTMVQMLAQNLFFMIVTGGLSAASWVVPHPTQLPLLLLIGVLGGAGQFLLFEAARFAPAVVIATVEYSALIWAFMLGYWIFGDIPDFSVWIGAAMILVAGVIMLWPERRTAFQGP